MGGCASTATVNGARTTRNCLTPPTPSPSPASRNRNLSHSSLASQPRAEYASDSEAPCRRPGHDIDASARRRGVQPQVSCQWFCPIFHLWQSRLLARTITVHPFQIPPTDIYASGSPAFQDPLFANLRASRAGVMVEDPDAAARSSLQPPLAGVVVHSKQGLRVDLPDLAELLEAGHTIASETHLSSVAPTTVSAREASQQPELQRAAGAASAESAGDLYWTPSSVLINLGVATFEGASSDLADVTFEIRAPFSPGDLLAGAPVLVLTDATPVPSAADCNSGSTTGLTPLP